MNKSKIDSNERSLYFNKNEKWKMKKYELSITVSSLSL